MKLGKEFWEFSPSRNKKRRLIDKNTAVAVGTRTQAQRGATVVHAALTAAGLRCLLPKDSGCCFTQE